MKKNVAHNPQIHLTIQYINSYVSDNVRAKCKMLDSWNGID